VIITDNSQVASNTISGHKPPSGKHANIIAGSVNGQDVAANSLTGANINEASLTGDVQKLIYNGSRSSPPTTTTIATVGPYTIKGQCSPPSGVLGTVETRLFANGPAGSADVMFDQTENDSSDLGTASKSVPIPASMDTQIVSVLSGDGSYDRIGGTAMLKTNTGTLVQVDFDAVADGRPATPTCFIYGTATRAT
jgi:hypothetical protein